MLLRAIALGSWSSSSLLWRHPGWRVRREPLMHIIRYHSRTHARALRAGPVVWPFLHLPTAAVEYHQSRRLGKNWGEKLVLSPGLIGHFHAEEGGNGRCPCVALAAGLGLYYQTWAALAGGSPLPSPLLDYRLVAAYSGTPVSLGMWIIRCPASPARPWAFYLLGRTSMWMSVSLSRLAGP